MKKIILMLILLLIIKVHFAQVSFNKETKAYSKIPPLKKNGDPVNNIDSLFDKGTEGDNYKRRFVNALNSNEAVYFFEGDTTHKKLFKNNLINYSPSTKQMSLFSEAINDYIGPIRIGIGFQIKSDAKTDSLSTKDSTSKLAAKVNAISNLQNSSNGDFNINLQYPLFRNKKIDALFKTRIMLYNNLGFSMPVLSKATSDFLLNTDFGLNGFIYAKGLQEKITFFSNFKFGYFMGNKNFNRIIKDENKNNPTQFFMGKISFGLEISEGYRFVCDLYTGNSFVKNNFPTTISFILRPNKENK
jgi:hypothetical protein